MATAVCSSDGGLVVMRCSQSPGAVSVASNGRGAWRRSGSVRSSSPAISGSSAMRREQFRQKASNGTTCRPPSRPPSPPTGNWCRSADERSELLRVLHRHRLAGFEIEDHFVFGAVILEHAADVLHPRDAGTGSQKIAMRIRPSIRLNGIRPLSAGNALAQLGGQIQRHEFVHEDEEHERKNQVQAPSSSREISFGFLPAAASSASSSAALAENRSAFMPSDMAWPSVPSPRRTGSLKIGYFSEIGQRALFGHDLAIRLANRDAVAVRARAS